MVQIFLDNSTVFWYSNIEMNREVILWENNLLLVK